MDLAPPDHLRRQNAHQGGFEAMRSWEKTEMNEFTDGMTLAEQIGQLFVVGFAGLTALPELLDLLQRALAASRRLT
jgi:hypothetical protein